ncbi:phage major capsid protein [Chromobacterium haemolyticum]|uniref:phage major capsid protein n=1 Tax=Chromobacterium haemolyticum TaxID=394935 RepID=UPI0040579DEA
MNKPIPRGLLAVRAESAPDVKAVVDSLHKTFSDFKAEHTRQIEDIRKGLPTGDQAGVVERINAEVDRLQKEVEDLHVKMAAGAGGPQAGIRDQEYSTAFMAHMKKGDVQASLNKGSDPDGGFLTPTEWDRTITSKLKLISPMRSLCAVQSISGNGFTKLFSVGAPSSGWVGESEARPATGQGQWKQLSYATGEIYANPSATQQILDDAEIDLESWLAGEVQDEFAKQENLAFLSGDGVNKPFGLLTYVAGNANANKHPFGPIAKVNSGAAAAITADSIISLIYDLPSAFAANAAFTMNRKTQSIIRKLKDGQGNYLWQPSYVAGQPATLGGYAITEVPDMPDVAANSLPILFGDFKQGYLILDRIGVRVLRDNLTNKPFVSFYTTKRVGGGLLNPEPLRALQVAV